MLKSLLVDAQEAGGVHKVRVRGLGQAGRGLHGWGHVQHVVSDHLLLLRVQVLKHSLLCLGPNLKVGESKF